MRRIIVNAVTALRIVSAIILLFLPLFSLPFYAVYTFGGLTDVLDGFLARKLYAQSRFGQFFDTAADFVFFVCCFYRLLPTLTLSTVTWVWIVALFFVKIICFCIKGTATHTVLLKITGILLFLFPYTYPYVPVKYTVLVLCLVATKATFDEIGR